VPDPRLDTLASVLCGYSLEVATGDVVLVEGPLLGAGLFVAVAGELGRRGAHPVMRPSSEAVTTALLERGSEAQLTHVSKIEEWENTVPDKVLTIWAESNTRRMSAVPPHNQALRRSARRDLNERFFARIAAGQARWCGVTLPTEAQAQDAGMAFAEYEEFVYGAGHLGDADPIEAWREVSRRQAEVVERLERLSTLRIVAEDTDLTVDVSGRSWLNADGHQNFPDGEVFTSPHEGATRGHVSFSFDCTYDGREAAGVRLWFEDGRVVREEASRGAGFLREMLDMDEGARRLGEVAFGLNDEIQRATGNIAFDEKIGGSCHIALGMAFPEAGGSNSSGLHWDMVCDLRDGGEVYGDGELIAKDGRFL
jgi:aminopeptidase